MSEPAIPVTFIELRISEIEDKMDECKSHLDGQNYASYRSQRDGLLEIIKSWQKWPETRRPK